MNECEHKLTVKLHQLESTKCLIYDNLCEDNENCDYKKLQRIEEIFSKSICAYDGCKNCIKDMIQQILERE